VPRYILRHVCLNVYYNYSRVFAIKMADKVQHTSLFEREHWIFSDIDILHVYNLKTSQLSNIREDEPFTKRNRVPHTPPQPGPLPPALSPHHYLPQTRRPLRPQPPAASPPPLSPSVVLRVLSSSIASLDLFENSP
jgi:hypothetical protein